MRINVWNPSSLNANHLDVQITLLVPVIESYGRSEHVLCRLIII